MQYLSVTGKSFEEALAKAYKQYGKDIHIYSRRTTGRARKEVEINFYITENKRKNTILSDDKVQASIRLQNSVDRAKFKEDEFIEYARDILIINDFSKQYIQKAISSIRRKLDIKYESSEVKCTKNDVELMLVDYIISTIKVDMDTQVHPPRIFVLLGPTGVGKTTTLAKIAALFGYNENKVMNKNVGVITLDTFRVGAYEQSKAFARALGISCEKASDEKEFYTVLESYSDKDLILVDTFGKSPKDTNLAVRLKTMLSVPPKDSTKCYLVVSPSMKTSDISSALEQFSIFSPQSLIITKIDETETIGNVLSISDENSLSLLFITDGQLVPQDIHPVSSSFVLSMLKGFSIDFSSIWNTQIN